MARKMFPGDRTVYWPFNGFMRSVDLNGPVVVYVDSSPGVEPPVAVTLADIRNADGTSVSGSLKVNATSEMPLWQGPSDDTDTLVVTVNGGPPRRVYARSDDRLDALESAAASAGQKMTVTPTKTSAFTASPWQLVLCDPTGGTFAVTLPAAATAGQQVAVKNLSATGSFTVVPAGSDHINTAGTSSSVQLQDQVITYASDGAGHWWISGGQKSVSSLDGRYNAINPIFSRFGSNYIIGDSTGCPTTSQITTDINNMYSQFGPRPLLLCFHTAYDGSTLKIVQFGFGGTTHAMSNVDSAVTQLIALGFTIFGIKVHNPGITTVQATSQFWTDYAALINTLAVKYSGAAPWFFIANEFESVTADAGSASALTAIVANVKSKGFSASASFVTQTEAAEATFLSQLDGVGLNVYPWVGTMGATTSAAQIKAAWNVHGALDYARQRKLDFPSKPVFITEAGSTDKTCSLEYTPSTYSSLSDNSGAVVGRYWDGVLRLMAADGGDVNALFGWDMGIFSPYTFTYSRSIMRAMAKAAVL